MGVVRRVHATQVEPVLPRAELDTHADTCVIGKHALIITDHNKPVEVSGYDPKAGHQTFQTVSAAIAFDDPDTGQVQILIVHQAIHIPHLDHHLLAPMQLRSNDVEVNDVPKYMAPNPTERTHAIVVKNAGGEDYIIRLQLSGVISYFPIRKPSQEEYLEAALENQVFELTNETTVWDPSSDCFAKQEEAMVDHRGQLLFEDPISFPTSARSEIASVSQAFASLSLIHTEGQSVMGMSSKQKPVVTPEVLAQRWKVGLESARRTLRATTQRGLRRDLTLIQRARRNDRHLRYARLRGTFYTDTLFAKTKSRRGNKCSQVFAHPCGWKRAYPLKSKGEAHEALSLMFAREGVPDTLMSDGAKETTLGKFRQKCRDADCHLKQTESYTPQANSAESAVKELKRGSG